MGPPRSRSPPGGSDWISRSVVAFARYEGKRPAGLSVDSSGAFLLSDLMAVWGDKQGVTKEQVFKAIEKNMYANSGAQRFELESSGGDYLIRAANRRGQNRSSASAGGWSLGGWSETTKANAASSQENGWASRSFWDKDAKSWDDAQDWKGKSWSKEEHSWDQERSWRSPTWEASSWKGNDATSSKNDAWRSNEEKVQRWLGWALKSGGSEFGLTVHAGGWASIEELAKELASRKTELGVTDADALCELLWESDAEGRFEFDEARGMMRKVSREHRHAGGAQASCQQEAVPNPATWRSWASTQAPFGSVEAAAAAVSHAERDTQQDLEAPSPPPGPHWTEYVDNDVYWWFYDGPLGKWWMSDADSAPLPWVGDD